MPIISSQTNTFNHMACQSSTCLLLLHLFFVCFLLCQAKPNKVPAVIVFGDSSVDAGNNNFISTIGRSNWPPYGRDFIDGKATGRFCNGRLSTDFISEAFGIKLAIPAYLDTAYSIKDFATGVTFASAGTGLDNVTSDQITVIPFWKEIEYFVEYKSNLTKFMGANKAAFTIREAVYILSIGTNDLIENYYQVPTRSSEYTIDQYEDFLLRLVAKFVLDIYKLGARKIALTGLTAFGCLPLERTTNIEGGQECREDYNKVARDFNVKLNTLISFLNKGLRRARVVYSGVYDSLVDAIDYPAKYGFEAVDVGCCGSGRFEMGFLCNIFDPRTCTDASKYIFWDSIHYTERMNKVVADHAMKTAFAEFL